MEVDTRRNTKQESNGFYGWFVGRDPASPDGPACSGQNQTNGAGCDRPRSTVQTRTQRDRAEGPSKRAFRLMEVFMVATETPRMNGFSNRYPSNKVYPSELSFWLRRFDLYMQYYLHLRVGIIGSNFTNFNPYSPVPNRCTCFGSKRPSDRKAGRPNPKPKWNFTLHGLAAWGR